VGKVGSLPTVTPRFAPRGCLSGCKPHSSQAKTLMAAPRAKGLAFRAFATFLLLDISFRLLGFERVYRLLQCRYHRPAQWTADQVRQQAETTFRAVQNATVFYYRRRKDCLPKALTTFHLLRRQGIPAELCFGVKKFPFAAHAWVESCGVILDDDPPRLGHYTVIQRVLD